MGRIFKKLISFVLTLLLCAGVLFVVHKKVFKASRGAPSVPVEPPKAEKTNQPMKNKRAVLAQKNKDRKPQKASLRPPSPIRKAYDNLKSQQIIVQLLKDKFFATHRLVLPSRPDELYDVRQSKNPKAEHLHIHGPFSVYLMVISVYDKVGVDQVLNGELKKQGLFEDDLKVLPAPEPRNTTFINEQYYELPGKGYRVIMLGRHRETKKTIVLRFRTQVYSREVGQFVQRRYRQIKVR